jgi:hypothetical protein
MAWANFHEQLTQHHSSEHRIAWPALRKAGISDDLLTQFDAEHDRMAAALESADQAMRSWRGTPSAENVKAAREAVTTLHTTATQHLDHEEAELEPFYLEHAHTPEMKAWAARSGASSRCRRSARTSPGCRTAPAATNWPGCGRTCRDRLSRSSAGSSAASTAAPSPRRGGEGERLEARASRQTARALLI